jgi:hypothetical protein
MQPGYNTSREGFDRLSRPHRGISQKLLNA